MLDNLDWGWFRISCECCCDLLEILFISDRVGQCFVMLVRAQIGTESTQSAHETHDRVRMRPGAEVNSL